MINENITNFHVEYMDVTQHWSEKSEQFAGADSLLTMLYKGWQMKKTARREERWFAGSRLVYIYYITLERAGETIIMPVVHNPFVNRMIAQHQIEIVPQTAADMK